MTTKLTLLFSQVSIWLILTAATFGAMMPGNVHGVLAVGAIIISIAAHLYSLPISPVLSTLSISLLLITGFLGYQSQSEIHIPAAILTAIVSILTHRRAIRVLKESDLLSHSHVNESSSN